MPLVESPSMFRKIYYRYIQEPFLRIKERWLAYFAEFADRREPSATDIEKEIQTENIPPITSDSVRTSIAEPPQRVVSRLTFISTTLGTTLGLGHLWRFPNEAYKSGGGAFLIIYTLLTFLFGYALYFMELVMGQYSSRSTLRVFSHVPLLEGIGYSMVAYSYIMIIYYSQIVGFGINYFASSFDFDLPWSHCSGEYDWNLTECIFPKFDGYRKPYKCPDTNIEIQIDLRKLCPEKNITYLISLYENCCIVGKCPRLDNADFCSEFNELSKKQLPSSYFWTAALAKPYDMDGSLPDTLGEANLKLLLGSFVAWFLIYVLVSIGLKWSGIFAITVMPLIFVSFSLMVLFGINLHGGVEGFLEFFVPNLDDFKEFSVWLAALIQSLFSLAIGMGPIITLGSISRFKNPCHYDSMIICTCVVLFSLLSTTAVFCVIGYMARATGRTFFEAGDVPSPGTALVAYSELITHLPLSWLCSAIFFALFILLGAVSVSSIVSFISFTLVEVIGVAFADVPVLNFLLVFSCFVFSIPMIMRGGISIFNVLDNLSGGIALLIICSFELTFLFVYGIGLFCEDISFMLGFYPNRFFRYSWIISPIVIIVAINYYFIIGAIPLENNWVSFLGLFCFTLVIIPIPSVMIGNIFRSLIIKNPRFIMKQNTSQVPASKELNTQRMEFHTQRRVF